MGCVASSTAQATEAMPAAVVAHTTGRAAPKLASTPGESSDSDDSLCATNVVAARRVADPQQSTGLTLHVVPHHHPRPGVTRKVATSVEFAEATDRWCSNDVWRAIIAQEEQGRGAAEKLVELRALLLQSGEPAVHTTDAYLTCCLRAKKYAVPKASAVAINYARFRRRFRWDEVPLGAASVRAELCSGAHQLLPDADRHGHVVLTQRMRLLDWSSATASLERYQQAGYYLLHRALQRPAAQTCGLALVLDFDGFGWSLFRRLRLSDLRRGVAMLQDCFPARLAVIYILHEPWWLPSLVRVLRPLLRADTLSQKFVLCGARYGERLHGELAAECIPRGWAGGTREVEWEAQVDAWVAE